MCVSPAVDSSAAAFSMSAAQLLCAICNSALAAAGAAHTVPCKGSIAMLPMLHELRSTLSTSPGECTSGLAASSKAPGWGAAIDSADCDPEVFALDVQLLIRTHVGCYATAQAV